MERQVNILRVIAVVFAVLSSALSLHAQEIRTTAPEEVLEHESFQIQYYIISSTPMREMPNLVDYKDFELIGEPKLSRSYPSPFWGRDYYTLSITCRFKAKKTGKLKLPRIELMAEGHKMSSRKGDITVRELPEMGTVDCFVKAHQTKDRVRVGDTLTITYKLYSTKEISNILRLNIAKIDDFYYQDITPRRATFVEEKMNGKDYKVYVIRKLLLKAVDVGTRDLSEGSVEIEYTYPTGRKRSDSWGRTYDEQLRETKSCKLEAVTISVHDMTAI